MKFSTFVGIAGLAGAAFCAVAQRHPAAEANPPSSSILHRSPTPPSARATAVAGAAQAGTKPPRQKPLAQWAKGTIVSRVHVSPKQRVVALTFDDGPWPVFTNRVLGVLKQQNVHATFFMIGRNVQNWPELARRVQSDGHAIGNHTWNHPSRPRGPLSEIARTDAVMQKELHFKPTLFRPPYGNLTNGLARIARKQGKAVVIWNADSTDWNRAGCGSICSKILRQTRSGGIVLMHDGGGNRAATVAALPIVIDTLRARGFRFVTVPELLALRVPLPPKPPRAARARRPKPGVPPHRATAARPSSSPTIAATPRAANPWFTAPR